MRKHIGIRPQDIVILVKILSFGQQSWLAKDLAISLFLSGSEVSESLIERDENFSIAVNYIHWRQVKAIVGPLAQLDTHDALFRLRTA